MRGAVISNANIKILRELGRAAALRFILDDEDTATLVDVAGAARPLADFDRAVLERLVDADLVGPIVRIVFDAAQQEFAAGERAGRALERHLRSLECD